MGDTNAISISSFHILQKKLVIFPSFSSISFCPILPTSHSTFLITFYHAGLFVCDVTENIIDIWCSLFVTLWVKWILCKKYTFTCTPFSRYHFNAFMPHLYPHVGRDDVNQIDISMISSVFRPIMCIRNSLTCFVDLIQDL